jgi:hypothetical protein
VNPRNIDYGQRIEAMRQRLLDNTLRDPDFRDKAILFLALIGLYIYFWWEMRKANAMKHSATDMLTAYQNQLAVASAQVDELSVQYAEAKRLLDEKIEAALVAKPRRLKLENVAPSSIAPQAAESVEENGKAAASPVKDSESGAALQLLSASDLINSLRQQLGVVTRKYEEEQQKNRKLRGE